MPLFLADPTTATYLLLAVLVAVAGVAWVRLRSRKATAVLAVAVGLLLVVVGCDLAVESPREEAKRRLLAMAAAATDVQPDRFVEQLSKSFSAQGANREQVRRAGAWGLIRDHGVTVTVSGMGHDDTTYPSETEVEIAGFVKAQLRDGQRAMWLARARFVRDPDGAYRMQTIRFFDALDNKQAVTVPGFP